MLASPVLLAAALITACALQPGSPGGVPGIQAPAPPATVAERSDYKATARLEEVNAFARDLAARSARVTLGEIGASAEGRSIPLLVIADPPVPAFALPAGVRAGGPAASIPARPTGERLAVLMLGGIHSGECDGKEALLALARDIATAEPAHPLLKDLILLVVPVYNPDGNERVGPDTRPGQVGPEDGAGVRENGEGLDLNRDFVKLEAPETRALMRLVRAWDPAVFIDTHTTNGSHHRYTITYGGPKNPAGNPRLIEFARDQFLPEVGRRVEASTGYKSFFYGNFNRDHTQWEDYPDEPRYGVPYFGMRNRLAILTESYSYATYKDRVLVQGAFVGECLRLIVEKKDDIRRLERDTSGEGGGRAGGAGRGGPGAGRGGGRRGDPTRAEADRAPAGGAVQPENTAAPDGGNGRAGRDEVILRSRQVAFDQKATLLGFGEEPVEGGRPRVTDQPRDYEVEHIARFIPDLSVPRPFAYIYPAGLAGVTENLLRHGVRVEQLREDIELDLEVYRIDGVRTASREFQRHRLVSVEGVTKREESRLMPAGSIVVRTAQPLGTLAAYLLEPQGADGLTAWNFFDDAMKQGEDFPVVRVGSATPFLSGAVRALDEDRTFEKPITFEQVLGGAPGGNFNGSPSGGGTWLDPVEGQGPRWLQNRDGRLRVVDARTGRSEDFLPADREPLAKALARLPGLDERTARSWAERQSFTFSPQRDGALFEHENDLYYARLDGSVATRLTSTPQAEEMASFSPDGRSVAFVRENDLWVVDATTGTERALTTGGSPTLRNGKNDWVYFEEVFGRSWRAYWWSPDSTRLAFLQIDSSPEPVFTIVNTLPDELVVEQERYPKPGDPNPRARVGVVTVAGGEPRYADLSGYSDYLVTNVGWWPDSSAACVYVTNRVQSWMDVLAVAPGGGEPRKLFRETTGAWVDTPPAPHFLRDGSFLFTSERSGWKHLYHYARDGTLQRPVTEGEWEVRSVNRVDEKNGHVYVTGTRDSHLAGNLYRVALAPREGEAAAVRLTTEPGSHRCDVSPDGSLFTDSWSSFGAPSRGALRSTADGAAVRTLDTNPVYDLEEFRFGESRLVSIPTPDGFVMEGSVLLPPNLDPAMKYPCWFMTYAGPQAPTVSDSWRGGATWDQALASEGFVVFRADPRPASGKGAASAWTAYKQLGVVELQDIETAIRWLCATYPFVDPARIGMSGHSYGGFMTSYAMTHSKVFAAGIAGAPVTDWADYDSIYTERYMLTPQENPEGYAKTSVVGAAKDLHGRLLLIHGMMDDNVHAQNSIRLIQALQTANKDFEMMFYPPNRHGIGGRHYQDLQVNFIRRTLGGPRKAEEGAKPAPSEAEESPGRRSGP